jgi:hypothetical protein
VDAVTVFSKQSVATSIFCGAHFDHLAKYLQQPFEARMPQSPQTGNIPDPANDQFPVTLYDLNPDAETREAHIVSVNEFEHRASALISKNEHAQLLFMRGQPSPEWLATIGAKYSVDPSFLKGHLDFWKTSPEYFDSPAFLSAAAPFAVRLCITTIGLSMTGLRTGTSDHDSIESLRSHNEENLREYQEMLTKDTRSSSPGESIIRCCSILDKQHFTIEQDISIWVNRAGQTWTG